MYGSVLDLAAGLARAGLSAWWAAVTVTHKHDWIREGRDSSQWPAALVYLLLLVMHSALRS